MLEGRKFVFKAVDVSEEQGNRAASCSRGGVLTCWSKELDELVILREGDSTDRVLVTCFNLDRPICIVNCYLASGDTKEAYERYCDDLDIITNMIIKYEESHDVIIIGDLNEDHHNRRRRKEKDMIALIENYNINDLGNDSIKYTYKNTALGHESYLDQTLLVSKENAQMSKWEEATTQVKCDHSLNVSHHVPVATSVTFQEVPQSKRLNEKDTLTPLVPMYKWKEVTTIEKNCYRKAAEDNVTLIDKDLAPIEAIPLLISALRDASDSSLPQKRFKKVTYKAKKSSPEIASAFHQQKLAYDNWVGAGKPADTDSLTIEKNMAQKHARSMVRRENAITRNNLYCEISHAYEYDRDLLHKLIKHRNRSNVSTNLINVNKILTDCTDIQRKGWANYFEDLAMPKETDSNAELLKDIKCIIDNSDEPVSITPDVLKKAIKNLNSNKAPDIFGLVAEHLKYLIDVPVVVELLCDILQYIFDMKHVSQETKLAFKIPIPKKLKEAIEMGNYRGLSLSTIIYKLIEAICIIMFEIDISEKQFDLQVGFTKGVSPFLASLLITEALADAYDCCTEVYACTLDAQKAFDVVSHPTLKVKLYNTGISKNGWGVIDQLYSDCYECVRWAGSYSRKYKVSQGVKQGGLLSAPLYKMYSNDFGCQVNKVDIGLKIGDINISTPVVADDTMLLASTPADLQTLMNFSHFNSEENYYKNHPTKSAVTILRQNKENEDSYYSWKLGDCPATQRSTSEHLGLIWSQGELAPKVDNKIALARRTSFSLTGIGIHEKGINATASLGVILCYVEPRLLTGLNATVLDSSKLKQLDRYYHKLIRQIQGLPMNIAREATYLFLNALPVVDLLNIRVLEMFGQICRLQPGHTYHDLAQRQLATKNDKSKSWFIYAAKIGSRYGLNLYAEFKEPTTKEQWKRKTKEAITSTVFKEMMDDATQKSTLNWVVNEILMKDKPHPIWEFSSSPYQAESARVRLRMLTGRYGLGLERRVYNRNADIACPICQTAAEDIVHVLTECVGICPKSRYLVKRLQDIYTAHVLQPPTTEYALTSAILNGVAYHIDVRVKYLTDGAVILPSECYEEATCITNRITRLAHERRLKAIEDKELP